jgi:nucleoside-diphosphate-sugar epimerase
MGDKKNILVTGGTGFVGAHLLFHLTLEGKKVKALKRPSSSTALAIKIFGYYRPFSQTQWELVEWIDGDIMDIPSLQDAFEGINQLYHVAAVVSFHGNNKTRIKRTNHEGTSNVVNISLEKKIDKLLFVSSIGTLGRAEKSEQVNEDAFWNNKKTSTYSKSKYEAEQEVWRGMAEGLNAVIINPSIILGPGDWSHGSPQLFQTMSKGLKFFTSGSNGFVCVVDVVQLMIRLMNSPVQGERFIISSENIKYEQLFNWMADALNVKRPHYKAGKLLSGIGWRLLWIKGVITGNKSSITKETAETANQLYQYSNKKIRKTIDFEFTSIKECVEQTAKLFLNDQK